MESKPLLVSVKQASKLLGMGKGAVLKLIKAGELGKLPNRNKHILVSYAALEQLAQQAEQNKKVATKPTK